MDESIEKNPHVVSWWITSLAISVTCCAILFVIFAGYLNDIKKQISIENTQLEQMALHEDKLLSEIQTLQRSVTTGQNPTAPGVVPVPTPTTSTQPTTPTTGIELPVAPVGTTAPTDVTPPPVAPTAIPEVPAKK